MEKEFLDFIKAMQEFCDWAYGDSEDPKEND